MPVEVADLACQFGVPEDVVVHCLFMADDRGVERDAQISEPDNHGIQVIAFPVAREPGVLIK